MLTVAIPSSGTIGAICFLLWSTCIVWFLTISISYVKHMLILKTSILKNSGFSTSYKEENKR